MYLVQNVNIIYRASFGIPHCKIDVLEVFCAVNCNAFEQRGHRETEGLRAHWGHIKFCAVTVISPGYRDYINIL